MGINFVYIFFFFISYLIGAIPFGLLVGGLLGKNLQKQGSGNIGATNATRILGIVPGALVFLLDFLKCFVPVLMTKLSLGQSAAVICGLCCVLGHIFSVYIKFTGGKGVSCIFAMYCALSLKLAVIFATIWLFMILVFRHAFIASISASTVALVCCFFEFDLSVTFAFLITTIVIILKHKNNILHFLVQK